jgi:hypothetical protein
MYHVGYLDWVWNYEIGERTGNENPALRENLLYRLHRRHLKLPSFSIKVNDPYLFT